MTPHKPCSPPAAGSCRAQADGPSERTGSARCHSTASLGPAPAHQLAALAGHSGTVITATACRSSSLSRGRVLTSRTLQGMRPPAASLVQHAPFGPEQRLLQTSQRHSVQRLKAALGELPESGVARRLPGNHPPPNHPRRMLHLQPGKVSGWRAAHSGPSSSSGPAPRRPAPALRDHLPRPLLTGYRDLGARSR